MGFLADDSSDVPSDYTFNSNVDFLDEPIQLDFGLDDIRVGGIENRPVEVNTNLNSRIGGLEEPVEINLDMGLNDVNSRLDMGLDNINACFSFAIKELPSMRIHYPLNYEFGFELLGIKLFNFCLAGKSMVVTEDNPVRLFHTPHRGARTPGTPGTSSFKVSVAEED